MRPNSLVGFSSQAIHPTQAIRHLHASRGSDPHPAMTCFALSVPPLHASFSVAVTAKRPRAFRAACRAQVGYVPEEDDRPEGASSVPTELTLTQKLLMKQYEDQIARMSPDECKKLAIEITRQMIVKDNLLRTMLKKDVSFGIEPPDPANFMDGGGADAGRGQAS